MVPVMQQPGAVEILHAYVGVNLKLKFPLPTDTSKTAKDSWVFLQETLKKATAALAEKLDCPFDIAAAYITLHTGGYHTVAIPEDNAFLGALAQDDAWMNTWLAHRRRDIDVVHLTWDDAYQCLAGCVPDDHLGRMVFDVVALDQDAWDAFTGTVYVSLELFTFKPIDLDKLESVLPSVFDGFYMGHNLLNIKRS